MRYMMIVKLDENVMAGGPPPELNAAIGVMAEEMYRTGAMVDTNGLLHSSKGSRIRIGGGKLAVTDGPFTEAKELIGGYAIMNADSHEQALEYGRRFMQLHADILGPEFEMELEIRPMYDMQMHSLDSSEAKTTSCA